MIVRMKENSELECLQGFLYNLAGTNEVRIRFTSARNESLYSYELEFDLVKLMADYPGCVEEALGCLSGELTTAANGEFQIESVEIRTLAERIAMREIFANLDRIADSNLEEAAWFAKMWENASSWKFLDR